MLLETDAVTEWQSGEYVLHQVSLDHYQLYGPPSDDHPGVDVTLMCFEQGVDIDWLCDFSTVGDVHVIDLHRPPAVF